MGICCDVCGGFATGGALHLVDVDDELVVVCRACLEDLTGHEVVVTDEAEMAWERRQCATAVCHWCAGAADGPMGGKVVRPAEKVGGVWQHRIFNGAMIPTVQMCTAAGIWERVLAVELEPQAG